jgi:hypothetical protein
MTKYQVISPDGLPIEPVTYRRREAAEAALARWCLRFTEQGYYAGVEERIALQDLPGRCRITELAR